ncbi:hypothetical protein P344_02010 [Spiroplasma mirum ATCC 29335]|uniref:Uncharacterized protein n=1 Tax=Spiroplasma mirum ATCC 29335 TaxID=838561 RepID=W0GNZ7_9MOLU|nr:hypothetical protein [Spiroplasma mirum]AHF60788.1 putative transmembrane protein [Spiroplasma mirum ATCC 29335]AHI57750.1 hypothetical protein P344_02010 [Spiroplasma mirum ATCC 29335]
MVNTEEKLLSNNSTEETPPVRELKFVEDDRPESLKKLDRTVSEKVIRNLGSYELKQRMQFKHHAYNYDLGAFRYYFKDSVESFGRIAILVGSLMMVITVALFIYPLAQTATSVILSIIGSKMVGIVGSNLDLVKPYLQIAIISLLFLWLSITIIIVVPILVCRTIKTMRIWLVVVAIIGTVNGLGIIGLAVVYSLFIANPVNWKATILGGVSLVIFLLGTIIVSVNLKHYYRELENNVAQQIWTIRTR